MFHKKGMRSIEIQSVVKGRSQEGTVSLVFSEGPQESVRDPGENGMIDGKPEDTGDIL